MSLVPFPVSVFSTADGNPVSYGFVMVSLDQDASAVAGAISNKSFRLPLDANGSVGSVQLESTAGMTPGTKYRFQVYTQVGQCISDYTSSVGG